MRHPLLLAASAVVVAFACTSDRPTTGPSLKPSADISDGANAANCTVPTGTCVPSNGHFFFLPPMVKAPTTSGVFNPNLTSVVSICQLGSNNLCVPNTTFNPGAVQLDLAGQQYVVNWNTDLMTLVVGAVYRIIVFAAGHELGFADVQPVSNGSQLKSVQTGELIGLVDGRTLPIKFRIERQVLCAGATDCVEATVGAAAQDVIAPSLRAAVHFDAGSFSQNVELVLQKVVTDGKTTVCHITDLRQLDDCYDISITPNIPLNAGHLARVEICLALDPASPDAVAKDPFLVKSEPGVPGVVELVEAGNTLIVCPGYPSVPPPPTITRRRSERNWFDLAGAGWRLIRGFFEPQPLHAAGLVIDEGLGGLTGSFSHFGFVIPERFSMSAGNGQTAPVGSILPVNPKVCLVTTHPHTTPVFGATVTFTITGGGGHFILGETTVDIATVPTDATGCSAVPWQLGAVAGTNTVMASVTFATQRTQTFTATGIPVGIISASVAGTSLDIGGLEGTATVTVGNGTGGAVSGLVVEGSILQGAVRQPAGISGDPFTCATATCRVSFNFVASSSPPGLLCGSATAEFDLKQTGSLLHTFSVPITLTSRGPCP